MALEREIKLRFDSVQEARDRVLAIGATPLRARRLQQDALFDTADGQLRACRSALRVREESGHSRLTFKGPPQAGTMKLREEHETVVGDGRALESILDALGLIVWFRYQKYREEFALEGVVVAIDETPLGVFVELEGSEAHIVQAAGALGCGPGDYITDSYRALFIAHGERHGAAGEHMVFPDQTGA